MLLFMGFLSNAMVAFPQVRKSSSMASVEPQGTINQFPATEIAKDSDHRNAIIVFVAVLLLDTGEDQSMLLLAEAQMPTGL